MRPQSHFVQSRRHFWNARLVFGTWKQSQLKVVHGAIFAFILIQGIRTRCNVEKVGDWRASLPLLGCNTGQYGYLLLGMDFMRLKSLEMFENLSLPLHSRQHFPGGLKVSLQLRVGHVTRLQSTNLEFCEKRRKRLNTLIERRYTQYSWYTAVQFVFPHSLVG